MSTSSSSEPEQPEQPGQPGQPDLPDLPETLDTSGAYPRLTAEQIMLLSRYGDRRAWTGASSCSAKATATVACSSCWTGESGSSRRTTPTGSCG
jgi:hypothetical protein